MLNNSFTAERLGRNTLFPNINIKDTIEMNIIITRLKGLGISIADGFSSTTEQKDEQLKKAYRPQCGQTQAFWSADKRNGGGAVENRTA